MFNEIIIGIFKLLIHIIHIICNDNLSARF